MLNCLLWVFKFIYIFIYIYWKFNSLERSRSALIIFRLVDSLCVMAVLRKEREMLSFEGARWPLETPFGGLVGGEQDMQENFRGVFAQRRDA